MFKIVLIAAVFGCALAAPAPYDNPPKSGVVQEISKYHVTEQNKQSSPVTHNAPSVKPSAVPDTAHPAAHADVPAVNTGVVGPTPSVPVTSHPAASLRANREADHTQEHKEEELKKKEDEKFGKPQGVKAHITGPTPVPLATHSGAAASLRQKREADHTQEHKEEELKKKEDEKFGKPQGVKAHITGPTPVPLATHSGAAGSLRQKREADHTQEHKNEELKKKEEEKSGKPEDAKKDSTASPIHKRESVPEKEEQKPQVNVKVPTEHSHDHSCGSSCTKDHQHSKRGATASTDEVNAKLPVIPAVHVTKEAVPAVKIAEVKKRDEKHTTAKAIVKREDSTTERAHDSTTHGHLHHITPTSVHSSFSHTWTRPEAQPAVEAHNADDKVPAASDNKPIIALIDPLKPVNDAKTSTTTVAPSTTPSVRRVRRGTDETEEQDEPKGPKPTKAWWRSLDLNKKEEVPKKAETVPAVHVKEADNKPVVTSYAAPAVVEKKQKRETDDEKRPSTGSPVTSTQKPNRGLDQVPQEVDNKPPQFVHPVPVAQILGQKQAELTAVKQPQESSERASKEEVKKQSEEKQSEEKHDNPHAFQKHQTKQD